MTVFLLTINTHLVKKGTNVVKKKSLPTFRTTTQCVSVKVVHAILIFKFITYKSGLKSFGTYQF